LPAEGSFIAVVVAVALLAEASVVGSFTADAARRTREVGVTTTDRAAVVHDSALHLIVQC
jgi:hypothetical protein